jgi:hypothetical protein
MQKQMVYKDAHWYVDERIGYLLSFAERK